MTGGQNDKATYRGSSYRSAQKEQQELWLNIIPPGPVLIGGGFITLLCSVEVCVRLYKAKKRVQDPELDNLINPHEVKHWMDPKIIPFGWGLFSEDGEEILVLDKGSNGGLRIEKF